MAALMERPIRPFYCVYLLRSTKRRASMYIGSTPDPRRRLRQHNNVSGKGGAHRTTRDNLQPWDMIVTVTGFPSKTAALQFEWAWQHPHLTRHLTKEEKIGVLTDTVKRRRGAEGSRRLARPSRSIQANILNLNLLLSVDSFRRWPLSIRFFAKDVFEIWQKWSNKDTNQPACENIPVHLDHIATQDLPNAATSGKEPPSLRGIEALDITYASIKPHLSKSTAFLDTNTSIACISCRDHLKPESDLILVCPNENCNMTAHLSCLATMFLKEEGRDASILPMQGTCPSCRSQLNWSSMMTELSLRMRGQDAIRALMKDPKKKSSKQEASRRQDAAQLAPVSDVLLRGALDSSPDQLADLAEQRPVNDDFDEFDDDDEFEDINDVLGEDYIEDEDDIEEVLAPAKPNKASSSKRPKTPSKQTPTKLVISDSEYEDIDEII